MIRPCLLLSAAAMTFATAVPASAGTCVTQNVPPRGDVTVCTTDRGCDVYVDPGGRILAFCFTVPADTSPLGVCTSPDLPGTFQVCALTDECTVFVTTGRPPGLCV